MNQNKIKYNKMIFALIATLVIVSPVAGYIATYKYLYGHMPCEPINNVYSVNRVGLEQDAPGVEQNTAGVEQNTAGVYNILFGSEEPDTAIELDNNIIFFNNNIRIEQNNAGTE